MTRLRRLLWGASLCWGLFRALWADAPLRRRYLTVIGLQIAVTLTVAITWLVVDGALDRYTLTLRRTGRMLIALYAAMVVAQWVVITVSRQHHDAISTQLARLVGVPPDEEVEKPRLTFDFGWVFEMFQRRVQSALVLVASAAPAVLLLGVVVLGPSRWLGAHRDGAWHSLQLAGQWTLAQVPNVALLAVSLYWLAVSTVGKSGLAWRDEAAPEWGPLRFSEAGSARHPALYGPLRLWCRLVRRPMGVMNRPAAIVERAPWESIGLSLVQLLTNLPILRLVLRPIVPVAATLVLESARGTPPELLLPGIARPRA